MIVTPVVKPGDVLTVDFPGATGIKRRPVVAISTDTYHANRPDVIVAVLTSRVAAANTPTDCVLQDWETAHLHRPTAFRAYLATVPAASVRIIGHLSDRDWEQVRARLQVALAVT